METNERIDRLTDGAFPRLTTLLADVTPRTNLTPLILSVGEPQHAPPAILADTVAANRDLWNRYPPIMGSTEFRSAAGDWLRDRYSLPEGSFDHERNLIALCGTKEGLYFATEVAVSQTKAGKRPAVLVPSPVYQTYVGAGVMAGADIVPMPASRETGFLPDFDAIPPATLERTALAFLCTPANPQGAIASLAYLKHALNLAREYGFVLAVDECYSEIYDRGHQPPGGLQAALALGSGFDNLLVFHSLSKRSNAAGLRAGFIAGDERLIRTFLKIRTYGAAQIPMPLQAAAAALWRDEAHVEANRALYHSKFDIAERVLGGRLGFYRPEGGFFLWLEVGDSVEAVTRLWRDAGVKVLPGAYLNAPDGSAQNPGDRYIRVALVHEDAIVTEALERIASTL